MKLLTVSWKNFQRFQVQYCTSINLYPLGNHRPGIMLTPFWLVLPESWENFSETTFWLVYFLNRSIWLAKASGSNGFETPRVKRHLVPVGFASEWRGKPPGPTKFVGRPWGVIHPGGWGRHRVILIESEAPIWEGNLGVRVQCEDGENGSGNFFFDLFVIILDIKYFTE